MTEFFTESGSVSRPRPSMFVPVEDPCLRCRITEGRGCCVLASRTKISSCFLPSAYARGVNPSIHSIKRERQSSRVLLYIACRIVVNKVNEGRSCGDGVLVVAEAYRFWLDISQG